MMEMVESSPSPVPSFDTAPSIDWGVTYPSPIHDTPKDAPQDLFNAWGATRTPSPPPTTPSPPPTTLAKGILKLDDKLFSIVIFHLYYNT